VGTTLGETRLWHMTDLCAGPGGSDMPESSPRRWDRLPGETSKAFAAFRGYLELGPQRTIAEAARVARRMPGQYKRWSAKWGWVERAAQYDANQAQQADVSRSVDRGEVRARLLQDNEHIRSVALGVLRTMIRRDTETGALTVDAGAAARAVVALFGLHLEVLDRLGQLPMVPGSGARGSRLNPRHAEQAGQGDERGQLVEQLAHALSSELQAGLEQAEEQQAEEEQTA